MKYKKMIHFSFVFCFCFPSSIISTPISTDGNDQALSNGLPKKSNQPLAVNSQAIQKNVDDNVKDIHEELDAVAAPLMSSNDPCKYAWQAGFERARGLLLPKIGKLRSDFAECRSGFAIVDLGSRIIEFFSRLWFGLPIMTEDGMKKELIQRAIIPVNAEAHVQTKTQAAMGGIILNPKEEKREVINFYAILCLYILTEKVNDEVVDKINEKIKKTENLTPYKYCCEIGALYDGASKMGGHAACKDYSRVEVIESLKKNRILFPHTETVVKTLYLEFD